MNSPVTYLGLIHIGLMIAFILSLFGIPWFWLNFFAAAMSDGQPANAPWMAWMAVAHILPIALFVAWWFT